MSIGESRQRSMHNAVVTEAVVRIIKGATRDLYETDSDSGHLALQGLWDLLDHLGFRLARKSPREMTLRVYPTRYGRYPLLNPRFVPTAVHLDDSFDRECLDITVVSKGQEEGLDAHLRAFPSNEDCVYIPDGAFANGYYYHGNFVLPIHFSGAAGREEIDFLSLGKPLARVLEHLCGDRGNLDRNREIGELGFSHQ